MPNKKLLRQLEGLFAERRQIAKDSDAAHGPASPPPASELRLLGWTWEADPQGHYTFCSPEVAQILGYKPDDMRGKSLASLLIADAADEVIAQAAIAQVRPHNDFRFIAQRKDGETVTLVSHGRPVFDDQGHLTGYQGVTHLAAPTEVGTLSPASLAETPEPAEPRPSTVVPVLEQPQPEARAVDVTPSVPPEPLAPEIIPSSNYPITVEPLAPEIEPELVPFIEDEPPFREPETETPTVPPLPLAAEPDLRLTVTEWRTLLDKQAGQAWGYVDDAQGLIEVGEFATDEIRIAIERGELIYYDDQHTSPLVADETKRAGRVLAVPIQLQDQTIGALDFFDENGGIWSEDDLALVQAVTDQLALALENARLFNATRDQLTKRTLLYEVTRAAAAAANLTEALQSAAQALGRVLPDANIAILLLDGETQTLRIRASVGFPAELAARLAMPVGRGLIGRTAQNNQPTLIGDVRQIPDYVAWDTRTVSELAVPLALGERVIGVLNVESPRLNAFDASDVQLLSTLAGTLAAIIVNNNLIEQINRERDRLALLNDVLAALTQTLDINTQLNAVLQFAPRLGAQNAYVLLLGETEADTLFRATVPGLDQFTEIEARDFGNTLLHRGLEQWVIEHKQAACVTDTRQDNRWYTAEAHVAEEPARSVISVPLRTQRGALSGVLAYTHPTPGALTRDQIPLVESISAQVTVALENARLYSQTGLQRRNAEALARATQAMNRNALDEAELMQVLVDELFETYRPEAVIVSRWEPAAYTLTPHLVKFDGAEVPAPEREAARQSFRVTARPDLLGVIQTFQGAITPLSEKGKRLTESMAHPLIYGGEVEGVVEVWHTGSAGERGLDQDDLNLMQGMMTTLTAALQTARLYTIQRETAERLAEVDRLKSQFLANMSHELRTPLNSIIGFSRVILKGIDGPLTDLQSQDLTSIYNSGQHLLGLINDILDLARIEAGKMELVLDEVDLRDIIKGVMSTAIGLVKDKTIVLLEDVAPNLPPVRADQIRVRQVMLNLLSNASKFTEQGSITLRAEVVQTLSPVSGKTEPFVQVSVVDTGHGIAPDDLKKLFEPFSQVDSSATRKVGGTGLGLNITRQLVDLHGGRIWVESEVGVGSTFSFILPLNRPELQDTRTEAEVAAGNAVILCVDDDQGVLQLYRRYLEPHGYKVVGVIKSVDALARVMEIRPLVILLDVLMPAKDGWQVLGELKQSASVRNIPVIMCTIASDPERAFKLGAADYLTKPILESDLLKALKKLHLPEPKNGATPAPEAMAETSR